jgi:hypothetical protein
MARQLQRPSQQDFQHQLVQGSSLRLVRLALGAVLPLRVVPALGAVLPLRVVQAPQVALAPQAALAERL